jgi:chromosome partitioning protein
MDMFFCINIEMLLNIIMNKRATVLSFANQKGGCGKSTTTLLVANALSQKPFNLKVLVIDADLQRTISKERQADAKMHKTFPYPIITSSIFDRKVVSDVSDALADYDIILIDIPGMLYTDEHQQKEMATVLAICDLIIIPIQATKPSIRASMEFLETCRKVKNIKDKRNLKFEVTCFINQKKNTNESQRSLPELIGKIGVNYLEADLSERVYYTRVFDTYTSILLDRGDASATGEFDRFLTKLIKLIEKQKINSTIEEISSILY